MKRAKFEEFKIAFNAENDPITKTPISQHYSKEEFNFLEPGETLFKLAAKMIIN